MYTQLTLFCAVLFAYIPTSQSPPEPDTIPTTAELQAPVVRQILGRVLSPQSHAVTVDVIDRVLIDVRVNLDTTRMGQVPGDAADEDLVLLRSTVLEEVASLHGRCYAELERDLDDECFNMENAIRFTYVGELPEWSVVPLVAMFEVHPKWQHLVEDACRRLEFVYWGPRRVYVRVPLDLSTEFEGVEISDGGLLAAASHGTGRIPEPELSDPQAKVVITVTPQVEPDLRKMGFDIRITNVGKANVVIPRWRLTDLRFVDRNGREAERGFNREGNRNLAAVPAYISIPPGDQRSFTVAIGTRPDTLYGSYASVGEAVWQVMLPNLNREHNIAVVEYNAPSVDLSLD